MSYHPLANDTGGTANDRREEASRILKIISDAVGFDCLTPTESKFVEQMWDDRSSVSPKQLFWLRDIKGKYL